MPGETEPDAIVPHEITSSPDMEISAPARSLQVLETSSTLTLTRLHELLTERGVSISYKVLSDFTRTGDFGQQLGMIGGGNRKTFPPAAIDTLTAFLPYYRDVKKGRLPQAPQLLREFLASRELVNLPPAGEVRQITGTGELAAVMPATALDFVQEYGRAVQDRILTATEAAEYLRCSRRSLRQHFRPAYRIGKAAAGDRWRVSDLLRGPND